MPTCTPHLAFGEGWRQPSPTTGWFKTEHKPGQPFNMRNIWNVSCPGASRISAYQPRNQRATIELEITSPLHSSEITMTDPAGMERGERYVFQGRAMIWGRDHLLCLRSSTYICSQEPLKGTHCCSKVKVMQALQREDHSICGYWVYL